MEGEEYPFSVYERALQLWKVANHMFTISPTMSQSYIRELIAICTANNFPPSNSFYLHVCSVCGILWYPDISMTMRIWRYSKIRNAVGEGNKRGRRGYRLMSTILLPNNTAPRLKGKEKERALYPVYECLCCGYRSIFDIYPVTRRKPKETKQVSKITDISPLPILSSVIPPNKEESRKMAQLQRILQRSANKQSSSNNKTNELSSFLSGLGPSLFKK